MKLAMKKALSFVVVLSMICSMVFSVSMVASAASDPTLTISSGTAKAGETVDVVVSMANNPGLVTMTLDVDYDSSVMTLTKVADSAVLAGQVHSDNLTLDPYQLSWVNDASATNLTVNGDLVTLTFTINANAAAGDYALTLGYDNNELDIYDVDINPVDFDLVNGKITVEGGVQPPVVNKYTVTYKVDGKVVMEYTDVEEGTATPTYEYTAPEGYTFSGWGEVPATVTEDLVIEGTTTEIPKVYYTVTFKADGAEDITITVEEGTAIGDQMPDEDPTSGTLAFDGWFDADGNAITANTVVEGDIVATAKFSRIVGDVNCDGVKDSKDAIYLLNHCALPDLYPVDAYEGTLDMNGDGVVSSQDAIFLLNSIAIPALYSLAW